MGLLEFHNIGIKLFLYNPDSKKFKFLTFCRIFCESFKFLFTRLAQHESRHLLTVGVPQVQVSAQASMHRQQSGASQLQQSSPQDPLD